MHPAEADEDGWHLSTDSGEKLDAESQNNLGQLKHWLSKNMRQMKLPNLFVEVDNDLEFTKHFMPSTQREKRTADDVCVVLATIMAHGCNIGSYTMA